MTDTQPSPRYRTHARTLHELRDEFISDLRRKLDGLDSELRHKHLSAAEASRIDRARLEIESILQYWLHVEIPLRGQKGRGDIS